MQAKVVVFWCRTKKIYIKNLLTQHLIKMYSSLVFLKVWYLQILSLKIVPGAPLTNFNDGGGGVRQRFKFYTQEKHNFRTCLPKKITTCVAEFVRKSCLVELFEILLKSMRFSKYCEIFMAHHETVRFC